MAKITLPNQRMFLLMDHVISNKIKGIDTKGAFFKSIGLSNASNLNQMLNGSQGFKPMHFVKACQVYNADGNFFLDKNHTAMFKEGKINGALVQLKEAVARVEVELKRSV